MLYIVKKKKSNTPPRKGCGSKKKKNRVAAYSKTKFEGKKKKWADTGRAHAIPTYPHVQEETKGRKIRKEKKNRLK